MQRETEEKLARSLTAETADLVPFLPYLLQDLWELGSNPRDMVKLIKKHMTPSRSTKVLDVACGKGAISVQIAHSLGVCVHGCDLLPDFIEYAREKAEECGVAHLCHFTQGDANEMTKFAAGYDLVIFGAAGDILGSPRETLQKLSGTILPGGYIIIDEAYLPEGTANSDVHYQNYDYLPRGEWLRLFEESGLVLLEELPATEEYDYDSDNKAIAQRAGELSAKHPEKRALFEGYIASQLAECEDLQGNITAVTWMLKKPCGPISESAPCCCDKHCPSTT